MERKNRVREMVIPFPFPFIFKEVGVRMEESETIEYSNLCFKCVD